MRILGLGALYEDVVLGVPHFPAEDTKLRATSSSTRIGGNLINTFSVLNSAPVRNHLCPGFDLSFCGAVGSKSTCKRIEDELQATGINPLLVYREEHAGPARAYILCSSATASRTVVSHNAIKDPSASTLTRLVLSQPKSSATGASPNLEEAHKQWGWIHAEGRNCPAVAALITSLRSRGWTGVFSVDFEQSRPGLDALIPLADILIVSRSYVMQCIKPCYQAEVKAQEFCQAWFDTYGDLMKPSAAVYITLGAAGCAIITKIFPKKSGYMYQHLEAYREVSADKVVETVGAGDAFIAGLMWAHLHKTDWMTAGMVANMVAGRKCMQTGFHKLWKHANILHEIVEPKNSEPRSAADDEEALEKARKRKKL